jgi:hypothetical protein
MVGHQPGSPGREVRRVVDGQIELPGRHVMRRRRRDPRAVQPQMRSGARCLPRHSAIVRRGACGWSAPYRRLEDGRSVHAICAAAVVLATADLGRSALPELAGCASFGVVPRVLPEVATALVGIYPGEAIYFGGCLRLRRHNGNHGDDHIELGRGGGVVVVPHDRVGGDVGSHGASMSLPCHNTRTSCPLPAAAARPIPIQNVGALDRPICVWAGTTDVRHAGYPAARGRGRGRATRAGDGDVPGRLSPGAVDPLGLGTIRARLQPVRGLAVLAFVLTR